MVAVWADLNYGVHGGIGEDLLASLRVTNYFGLASPRYSVGAARISKSIPNLLVGAAERNDANKS